jgi:hypothetical protein
MFFMLLAIPKLLYSIGEILSAAYWHYQLFCNLAHVFIAPCQPKVLNGYISVVMDKIDGLEVL